MAESRAYQCKLGMNGGDGLMCHHADRMLPDAAVTASIISNLMHHIFLTLSSSWAKRGSERCDVLECGISFTLQFGEISSR